MTLYVAMVMRRWRGLRVHDKPLDGGPGVGFLVVFPSADDARAAYPGATIATINVPDSWALRNGQEVM